MTSAAERSVPAPDDLRPHPVPRPELRRQRRERRIVLGVGAVVLAALVTLVVVALEQFNQGGRHRSTGMVHHTTQEVHVTDAAA